MMGDGCMELHYGVHCPAHADVPPPRFSPPAPPPKDPSVTRRVLDFELFMNSKTLFKFLRYSGQKYIDHRPVMIHVNYHSSTLAVARGWPGPAGVEPWMLA